MALDAPRAAEGGELGRLCSSTAEATPFFVIARWDKDIRLRPIQMTARSLHMIAPAPAPVLVPVLTRTPIQEPELLSSP